MVCSKCGKQLEGDVKFCPSCGTSVEASAPAPAPAPEPTGPQISAAPFGEVIKKLIRVEPFLSLDGRSRRGEYWCTVLLTSLPLTLAGAIAMVVTVLCSRGGVFTAFFLGLAQTLVMASTVSMYPVFVRRLHDLGITSWLAVGLIAGQTLPYLGPFAMFVALIVFGCIPGRPTENAYGASPLVPDATPVAEPRRERAWIIWAVVFVQVIFGVCWNVCVTAQGMSRMLYSIRY